MFGMLLVAINNYTIDQHKYFFAMTLQKLSTLDVTNQTTYPLFNNLLQNSCLNNIFDSSTNVQILIMQTLTLDHVIKRLLKYLSAIFLMSTNHVSPTN